jgi:tetratricopeptide (TPR) repeat protein
LYSTKLTSTLNAASEQEYQSFINAGLTYRDSGATPELLKTLDELPSDVKRNPIVTALYKDVALDLYYETGTPLYLDKLDTLVHQQSSRGSIALYNLFYLEVAKGNLTRAADIIHELEGLTNNDSAMYELYAYTAMANNDYQKAINHYKASLSIRETANNLYNIANAYRYYGNNELAKSYAEQALTLSPKLHQANSLLGFIALLNGNIDHAIASFEKAVKQNPSDISNLTHLGLSNLLKPDYAEAKKMFVAALKISPDNTTILLNHADAENLQGNMSESRNLYEKIISIAESRQRDETTLRNLAQSYAHLSRFSEALSALQELEKADSQNIETFYTAALVHTLAENTRSAIFNIEKSLTNGLNSVWFRVSWFDPLCNESSFQTLMEKYGEPDRCALRMTQSADITADASE